MSKKAFEKIAAGLNGVREMTAMQAAFEKEGLSPRDVELDLAIAKYINSGGTIEQAQSRLDVAAKRMPGMDHQMRASDGQSLFVQTRQPVEDGGAIGFLPEKGHVSNAPPSSSNRGQEALQRVPSRATERVPPVREPNHELEAGRMMPAKAKSPLPPAREPSTAYLKAAGESRLQAARNVLYRYRTSDGRWWGDVCPYESAGVQRDNIRHMALLSACGQLNEKQMKMTYAQLLKPAQALIAMDDADREMGNVA